MNQTIIIANIAFIEMDLTSTMCMLKLSYENWKSHLGLKNVSIIIFLFI